MTDIMWPLTVCFVASIGFASYVYANSNSAQTTSRIDALDADLQDVSKHCFEAGERLTAIEAKPAATSNDDELKKLKSRFDALAIAVGLQNLASR